MSSFSDSDKTPDTRCRKHSLNALKAGVAFLALFFAGCSWVPRSAPTQSQVRDYTKSKKNAANIDYKLLAMTSGIADILSSETRPLISTLGKYSYTEGTNDHIGPGDFLSITIFELGNGLFTAADRTIGSTGSDGGSVIGAAPHISTQTLPPTQVESDGTIMVPYVGRLNAKGRTPSQVATMIEKGLKGKSQHPQVMVRIQNDIGNTVIVSGEVAKPGRVVLSLADEHLSDVVAIAGGAKYPPNDTLVELVRHNKIGATDLATLENHPEQDLRAAPGDRVRVIYQPRTFTAFGAVGQTQQRNEVKFGTANLTLAGALSRIGGPSDSSADPNGVYLIRYEDEVVCKRLGIPLKPGQHRAPVAYEVDLMNPTQYFLAQKIPVKDHDVILVTDAASDRFFKINMLIGTLLGEGMSAGLYAR